MIADLLNWSRFTGSLVTTVRDLVVQVKDNSEQIKANREEIKANRESIIANREEIKANRESINALLEHQKLMSNQLADIVRVVIDTSKKQNEMKEDFDERITKIEEKIAA